MEVVGGRFLVFLQCLVSEAVDDGTIAIECNFYKIVGFRGEEEQLVSGVLKGS